MFHEAIRQHSVHQAAMIALGASTPSSATVDVSHHCNASEAAKVSVSSSDASDCCATQNPCLPRNTIVLISGNNRTRRSLIGQHAVIRRSVGLGGWHHVVLQDGTEVKLQRNALSVLEMGPPETLDPSGSSSDTEAREPKLELIATQPRIRRPPRALFPDTDLPLFKRTEATNSSGLRSTRHSLVDLHKLECTSLKRYRRAFQLGEVDAAAPKADLATAVQRHFTSQEVDEDQVLCELVIALRRRYKQQQQQQQRQRLLVQQQYSQEQDFFHCQHQQLLQQHQQQQQLEQEEGEGEEEDGEDTGADDEQLRRLILLQQQYVYLGPCLFQSGQQQQQQQC